MSLLLIVPLGIVAYFLLTLLAVGAFTLWCDWQRERNRMCVERLAFERHADSELREHMQVVGGARISSDERWR